jgi:hypothetical protein
MLGSLVALALTAAPLPVGAGDAVVDFDFFFECFIIGDAIAEGIAIGDAIGEGI